MPYVARVAAGQLPRLTVFGNDYPTRDGTCLRDYLHVVDLAKGHISALEYAEAHSGAEAFNLGTGDGVSVLELVTAFEKANGVKLNYRFAPRRAGDVTAVWADPSLANRELGWKAKRSVEQTLAAAWAWEKHLAGL